MDVQESKIYISIIIATFVVSIIVLSFFYATVKHHKRLLRLERENARAQVEVLEKDRARIAQDLHDDLASMLAAVRMRVNSFDLSTELDKERLMRTNAVIDDIAKKMRAISFDLMPSSLQEKGLEKAVQEFINYLNPEQSLKICFMHPSQKLKIDEYTTIHLYRIIQELIHNTMKHAKADELILVLKKENESLILASEDNGIGFDPNQRYFGLGMKSLQNRVHLLNGTLDISSRPGQTKVSIQIPQHA